MAKEKTQERQERQKPVVIELLPEALLPFTEDSGSYSYIQNIGYAAISFVFHTLGIHTFIDERRTYLDISYNLTAVMKLLVYERILSPDVKRASWMNRSRYFDKMDFDLHAVYRSLSIFPTYQEDLLQHLHRKMVKLYNRDSTLLFSDVTKYYFAIDYEDALCTKGVSTEHRTSPIVQIGLFLDEVGFPVTYDLFAGTTNDYLTLWHKWSPCTTATSSARQSEEDQSS